jgi:hypothetical protein
VERTFDVRNLLGGALLKEVITDDWRIRLDPESAHVLLSTALLDGKAYRYPSGELMFSRLSPAFRNRHIDGTRVRTYAHKMETYGPDGNCEWKDRITEIGISPEGVLSMGFHTCLAVILSGTSHEVRLLANFTASERDSEGTGRKQDFADVLYYYGIPNARSTAALTQIIVNHRRTLSPLNSITAGSMRNTTTELMKITSSPEMPLITEAVAYAKRLSKKFYSVSGKYKKRSAVAPAIIAHLYLEWMQAHPVEAVLFFQGLETGEDISGTVLLLRERLGAIANGAGTPLDMKLNVYIRTGSLLGQAWKHHLAGTELTKLQLSDPPAPVWCEQHRP